MKKSLQRHSCLHQLVNYWGMYWPVEPHHYEWLLAEAEVLPDVKRGTRLYEPGDRGSYVYFVCEGLLAAVWWDEEERRRIEYLAPPLQSLFTTGHLYTATPVEHSIVALRRSRIVRLPSAALKRLKEMDSGADTLVHVMRETCMKQYRQHTRLMLMANEVARFIAFYTDMKDYRQITSQPEQGDYLNISKMSITRALRIIRNRR